MQRTYIAIDLKSFYASVECVERRLDPLSTNLVVADGSRTDKTICLAVTPSLKAHGVPSRPRLFEVISRVREVNADRRWRAPSRRLTSSTYDDKLLRERPELALGYITAPPRMSLYIEYSNRIYEVYLKYFAPEDIHIYSIDEVFIDITHYGRIYKMSARELAQRVVDDVLRTTGITATVGIGTNLYLAKVAMDIVAKHLEPDRDGVRIAELDEASYRRLLWEHRPLTDFWRVGHGYMKKLERYGMYTMGDIALMSVENEALLYKLFGVNAELLIDHAWGYEPCRMEDIKSYKPRAHSVTTGQVLHCPYRASAARLIVREMCDLLSLDLVEKGVLTRQLTLTVGYDTESLADPDFDYQGEICLDYLGRAVPKAAHGTANLPEYTSGARPLTEAILSLYDRIIDPALLVRRVNIAACDIRAEGSVTASAYQYDIFSLGDTADLEREREVKRAERERCEMRAIIDIKHRFGKNAILKGMNFEEGGTTIDRNMQIGGHKA